jgi:sperm-associated antigen 16 protein
VQALRGHADSVNEVAWLPFTNALASASSDKTVALWEARTGLCTATLYGHGNSINSVCASLDGGTLASCDADGYVKFWDVRGARERGGAKVAACGAARVRLDRAGAVAAVAADDGKVYSVDVADPGGARLGELAGHDDAVASVAFDPAGEFVVTASSDCTFKVWR